MANKQADRALAAPGVERGAGRRVAGGTTKRRAFGLWAPLAAAAIAGCQFIGGFDEFGPTTQSDGPQGSGTGASGGVGGSGTGGSGGAPGAGAAGAAGGACTATCDGVCVDTQSDPAHCGSCENSCQGAPICDRAQCARFALVSAGAQHACSLADNGSLWCWGRNDRGQLGDGSGLDSSLPKRAADFVGATALALGGKHGCVLQADKKVSCWGATGQFGTDAINAPALVEGLDDVTQLDAGARSTCARRGDGTAWCWPFGPGATPTQVAGFAGVTQITTGGEVSDYPAEPHTCVLLDDGASWCWGSNGYGQLGIGTSNSPDEPDHPTPGQVTGAHLFTQLGAGHYHTCGLRNDATVWCWGRNDSGQLGNNLTTQQNDPVQVSGLAGVTRLAVGGAHACAQITDGTVWCWGENAAGQLGNGSTAKSLVPAKASIAAGVNALTAGAEHTCALLDDGTSWCWGRDRFGQLGDGRSTDASVPTQVPDFEGAAGVAVGANHACATRADGSAWCWGLNSSGQLGNGTLANARSPVQVSDLTGVAQVVVGNSHSCARLQSNGTVWCWGDNRDAQLGNGGQGFEPTPKPAQVSGLANVAQLAAGRSYTCARREDGSVSCWGYGYGGPFLDGESTQLVPTPVKGVSNIVQIAGYGSHVCGVRSDGQGWCWGSNFSAQLGTGGPTGGVAPLPPGQVVGVDGLAEVAVGFEHSCARRSGDKRVWCWGSHFQGQLGNGETSFGASPPVLAEGLEGVEQIAAANNTSCALSTGGALFCWGSNSDGQFGSGSSSSKAVPRPAASPGATGFARLSLSGDSACATRGDGALFCWGTNTQGKLGLGPSADSPLPVRVFGAAK